MAYIPSKNDSYPSSVQPAVLSVYVPNSTAETNILVNVPWRNCRLTYAYTVVVSVIDAAASAITLELNASGGTTMMTIAVAGAAPVGDIDEAVVVSRDACGNLSRDNAPRDAVNIKVDSAGTATGGWMLYLYFESDSN
jgi:hypothetical protein